MSLILSTENSKQQEEEDVLGCISDAIGDLKDMNILAQTGDIKPVKKTQAKPKIVRKPWEEAKLKAKPKPKAKPTKVSSQWEIREQLAKKKRENIYAEVKRKREKEEELKKRSEVKAQKVKIQKEKDRSDRLKKREEERKKMKDEIRKKRQAVKKTTSNDSMDFEFVGPSYESNELTDESGLTKDSATGNEEEEFELVHKQITDYQKNLILFLDKENISDEEDEDPMTVKNLVPAHSEDRDNIYNNGLDESEDLDSPKKISNLKGK